LALTLGLAMLPGPPAPIATAATRDAGFYPVSAKPPETHPAPAVRLVKVWEAVIPGRPQSVTPGGAAAIAPRRGAVTIAGAGSPIYVETREGAFAVDESTGAVTPRPSSVSDAQRGAGLPAGPATAPAQAPGEELEHSDELSHRKVGHWFLRAPPLPGAGNPVWSGEEGIVALLAPDGTIYGRKQSNGHLLWRRVAPHRISMPGGAAGPYLLVAPDASRALEVYRWSDGSSAGSFLLDSEDAAFASGPVVLPPAGNRDRIYVLTAQAPRAESRLLALRIEPITEAPRSAPR
jgi:hypothetical protein